MSNPEKPRSAVDRMGADEIAVYFDYIAEWNDFRKIERDVVGDNGLLSRLGHGVLRACIAVSENVVATPYFPWYRRRG